MTAINGFGGIYIEDGELKAKPQLPSTWKKLRFKICYKGELYLVEASKRETTIKKCLQ